VESQVIARRVGGGPIVKILVKVLSGQRYVDFLSLDIDLRWY
jgi:hypothetical protein